MGDEATIIEDCEKRQEKMSDWEVEFIDSLSCRLVAGNSLTEKQRERLDSIWERVTANG